jgi:crotonobetainyl-CoA:carnitine CoA-transferase CaiB-like acyl-CoA transferase
MQDAINELKQAEIMLNNASNRWRIDEATARITAAQFRIQAIRHEREMFNNPPLRQEGGNLCLGL